MASKEGEEMGQQTKVVASPAAGIVDSIRKSIQETAG
jgi:hypothetical protein